MKHKIGNNQNDLSFDSSPKKSFWNQLETDIEEIGHRARTNLQKYQENKVRQSSNKQLIIQMPQKKLFINKISPVKIYKKNNDFFKSIDLSTARRIQNEQKQKQKLLKNRIKFLEVEEHKQFKTIELARKKYQKIITVRNSSLKEKQIIKKRQHSMMVQQLKENELKVKKVKKEDQIRLLSISRLKQQNKTMGQRQRRLKRLNSIQINKQKSQNLSQKKSKIRQTKTSLSISRQKYNQVYESRLRQSKNQHKIKILQKFRSIQVKNKINNRLSSHLTRQIEIMKEKKRRSTLQLQSFQKALGLNMTRKIQTPINLDKKNRNKKGNSFYLTSY